MTVYNILSIIIFKKVGFELRTKDTKRWHSLVFRGNQPLTLHDTF